MLREAKPKRAMFFIILTAKSECGSTRVVDGDRNDKGDARTWERSRRGDYVDGTSRHLNRALNMVASWHGDVRMLAS